MSLPSRLAGRFGGLRPAGNLDVAVERDLEVPVGDGVVLLADRWVPAGPGPAPLVLVRSPYGRRPLDLVGRLLAERGYQVLVQSVRGTFGSGGTWEPFRHEREDGAATLAWLAGQPWWPGRVGTFGPSYLGLTQWALLSGAPGSVSAAALAVTSSVFRDAVVYPGGSFALETGAAWLYLLDNQERGAARLLGALGARRALRRAHRTLPLERAEAAALGHRVGYYQDWLRHERPGDPWWAEVDFAAARQTPPPVSMTAGWFDIFLPYQLDDYAAIRSAGGRVELTIGPWTHSSLRLSAAALADAVELFDAELADARRGGTELAETEPADAEPADAEPADAEPADAGPADAGPADAGRGGTELAGRAGAAAAGALRRGGDRGRVRLRLVGRRAWVVLDDWPPPGERVRWYLHGDGGLRRSTPVPSGPTRYRFDPGDPTPGVGGASLDPSNAGRRDQRRREARGDVRTWTTDPLPAGLLLVGPVEAEIWVRSSNWFTDVLVRLCTVSPSGRSLNLSDGILRLEPGSARAVASVGATVDGAVIEEREGIVAVRVRMWPVGIELGGGCRLRLQVSGGAHPLFARNLGGGERLGTGTRLVPADHEVFHDPEHLSAVVLPFAGLDPAT